MSWPYKSDRDHFLNSATFHVIQRHKRWARTLMLSFDDIEPESKRAMSEQNKLLFQDRILDFLIRRRRKYFSGLVALEISLFTTTRNPPQAHTVAKNLLDLLGKPLPGVRTKRKGLLYADDSQVSALSVSITHGQPKPWISLNARPLRDLLDDLRESLDFCEDEFEQQMEQDRELDHAIEWLSSLKDEEEKWRANHGDDSTDGLLDFAKQRVQEPLLRQASLSPRDIARLFAEEADRKFAGIPSWGELFSSSVFRIRLDELPQETGQSSLWKTHIETEVSAFKKRFAKFIDPLKMPIALEVLVRPPHASRQKHVTDLDNILRDYLIPKVVDALKPPSHYDFALPRSVLDASSTPPASTRIGITRYEAWRLPPARTGEDGFVSLSVVPNLFEETVIGRIARLIDKAAEKRN